MLKSLAGTELISQPQTQTFKPSLAPKLPRRLRKASSDPKDESGLTQGFSVSPKQQRSAKPRWDYRGQEHMKRTWLYTEEQIIYKGSNSATAQGRSCFMSLPISSVPTWGESDLMFCANSSKTVSIEKGLRWDLLFARKAPATTTGKILACIKTSQTLNHEAWHISFYRQLSIYLKRTCAILRF